MAEIRVPTLGESVTEATIGKWFKKPGEAVAVDEPLVELETDKVTIEVPAPAAGVLGDIAAKDGETVAVGALLGQIREGAGAPEKTAPPPPGRPDRATATAAPAAEEAPRPQTGAKPAGGAPRARGDGGADPRPHPRALQRGPQERGDAPGQQVQGPVGEDARGEVGLHGFLREGLGARVKRLSRRQRRDRRQRHHLQEL